MTGVIWMIRGCNSGGPQNEITQPLLQYLGYPQNSPDKSKCALWPLTSSDLQCISQFKTIYYNRYLATVNYSQL